MKFGILAIVLFVCFVVRFRGRYLSNVVFGFICVFILRVIVLADCRRRRLLLGVWMAADGGVWLTCCCC